MLRAAISLLLAAPRYGSKEHMKRLYRRSSNQYVKEQLRVKYAEGLARGDEVFGVAMDRRAAANELKRRGQYSAAARGGGERGGGSIYNERHAQQQALLRQQDYGRRELSRIARNDRETSRVAKLQAYHFPMLK